LKPWKQYQEDAAEFFRSIGLKAQTDLTVIGIRTKHDVDVFVELDVAGFEIKWVVECKHWQDPVNKLHVLGLRQIVTDLGADRGILLCEVGFQEGAVEAANLTNVQVTSLAALKASSKGAIYAARLDELFDRVEKCRERYWDIPKAVRIDLGLRPDVCEVSYSGTHVIEASQDILRRAHRGTYPIAVENPLSALLGVELPPQLSNPEEVVIALDPLIAELEGKLDAVPE
jgi:restriction system protein